MKRRPPQLLRPTPTRPISGNTWQSRQRHLHPFIYFLIFNWDWDWGRGSPAGISFKKGREKWNRVKLQWRNENVVKEEKTRLCKCQWKVDALIESQRKEADNFKTSQIVTIIKYKLNSKIIEDITI